MSFRVLDVALNLIVEFIHLLEGGLTSLVHLLERICKLCLNLSGIVIEVSLELFLSLGDLASKLALKSSDSVC